MRVTRPRCKFIRLSRFVVVLLKVNCL